MAHQRPICSCRCRFCFRLSSRTDILRIHLDTLDMKIHHTGRLREIWVHKKLGEKLVHTINKHNIELQYDEETCLSWPPDMYKTVQVYAIIKDPKLAFWFKLKGHL